MLPQVFPEKSIEVSSSPVYELFGEENDLYKNLIFINARFSPDKYETKLLLQYAATGGNVFVSTEWLDGDLADTLGVSTVNFSFFFSKAKEKEDTIPIILAPDSEVFYVKQSLYGAYINTDSAENFEVLGNYFGKANFVKFHIGHGNIYLHTIPKMFSNYEMVDPMDWRYAFRCLSYLPVKDVIWDEHYKGFSLERSPLSYALSQAPLRWAYYLLMIGLLIYIFFEGKRRQRIIPVVEPLRNTTLEFVETVGRLYYQNRNHRDLAAKKIAHFYDFLHHKLHIRYQPGDVKIVERLSQKSGLPEEKIKHLFDLIELNSKWPTESTVIELSQKIDEFYKQF
jgi:hypothetical protein